MASDPPGVAANAVAAVLDAVRAGGLLDGARPLLAMVSGGRDSVCLLDVAVTLLGAERVSVLHVDYGLRAEAAADAELVGTLCSALAVPVRVLSVRRPEDAPGNLQAWARDVRYGEAVRLATAAGALVATGHTATDQVETVLYRLAASPGRRALLGMPSAEGRLVRPLLGVTREQTAAYCGARGLSWREDASNDDVRYMRARARGGLAPTLRDLHPAAEANLLRTVELLRDEAAVLDEVVDTALAGRDRIALSRLAELPAALARLVARRLAEDAAGRLAPQAGSRLPELLALGARGGSAALDLGGGLRALVEYGVLRFSVADEEPTPAAVELAVPGGVRFGAWEVRCDPADDPSGPDDGPGGDVGDAALFDADALGAPLVVRPWQVGDRMAPAGVGGTRTLSDLFTDRRLPRAGRRTIPVIEARGDVAWIPGVASGEAFRVTESTRSTARLSARRVDAGTLYTRPARMSESTASSTPPVPVAVPDHGAPSKSDVDSEIGDVMVSAEALQERVRSLGREISRDYAGRRLLLIGVLKGAVFFLSDLMRWIDIAVEVDFMAVASYGSATDSSGVVRILKDLDASIEGRDVLIVEDIVDSGLTLQYLLRNLGSRNPRSLEVCALLTKPDRRKVDLPTRYVGFEIPNRFVIGYGLDHAERYRNLPFVAALKQ
jgi:tRNA(Ile)-lysidine synthase